MLVSTRTGAASFLVRPGLRPALQPVAGVRVLVLGGAVDLVEEEEMLVLAEDVGDVRHPLLAVAHQRVDGLLDGVGRALAGHDDRAELQRGLLHVRDLDVGLEAAHVAGLVLPHDELDVVLAWREREAGGVLHVLLLHLLVGIDGEVHRLAHLADDDVLRVLDLAQDVDGGLVLVLDLHGVDLRAGDRPARSGM